MPPDLGTAAWLLAAALLVYTGATLLRAERWRLLLALEARTRPRRGEILALTTVGYMGNNILPARAGDIMKAVLAGRRTAASGPWAFGSVVAERALDAIVLLALYAALAATALPGLGLPAGRIGIGFAAIAVLAAVVLWRSARLRALALRTLATAAAPARRLLGWRAVPLLAISGAIWLLEGATYVLALRAAGPHVSYLSALYVMAISNVAMMIPAGPGYAGTFDAAVVVGLRAVTGAAGGALVAAVVLLRIVLFVPVTAAGAIVFILRYRGVSAAERGKVMRASAVP